MQGVGSVNREHVVCCVAAGDVDDHARGRRNIKFVVGRFVCEVGHADRGAARFGRNTGTHEVGGTTGVDVDGDGACGCVLSAKTDSLGACINSRGEGNGRGGAGVAQLLVQHRSLGTSHFGHGANVVDGGQRSCQAAEVSGDVQRLGHCAERADDQVHTSLGAVGIQGAGQSSGRCSKVIRFTTRQHLQRGSDHDAGFENLQRGSLFFGAAVSGLLKRVNSQHIEAGRQAQLGQHFRGRRLNLRCAGTVACQGVDESGYGGDHFGAFGRRHRAFEPLTGGLVDTAGHLDGASTRQAREVAVCVCSDGVARAVHTGHACAKEVAVNGQTRHRRRRGSTWAATTAAAASQGQAAQNDAQCGQAEAAHSGARCGGRRFFCGGAASVCCHGCGGCGLGINHARGLCCGDGVDVFGKAEVGDLFKPFHFGQQAMFGQLQQQVLALRFGGQTLGGLARGFVQDSHFHARLQAHAGKFSRGQDHFGAVGTHNNQLDFGHR